MAQWYVVRAGKEHGPFHDAQLKALATSGKVKPDDQVRRSDQVATVPASRITGLFAGPQAPPPLKSATQSVQPPATQPPPLSATPTAPSPIVAEVVDEKGTAPKKLAWHDPRSLAVYALTFVLVICWIQFRSGRLNRNKTLAQATQQQEQPTPPESQTDEKQQTSEQKPAKAVEKDFFKKNNDESAPRLTADYVPERLTGHRVYIQLIGTDVNTGKIFMKNVITLNFEEERYSFKCVTVQIGDDVRPEGFPQPIITNGLQGYLRSVDDDCVIHSTIVPGMFPQIRIGAAPGDQWGNPKNTLCEFKEFADNSQREATVVEYRYEDGLIKWEHEFVFKQYVGLISAKSFVYHDGKKGVFPISSAWLVE